MLRNILAAIAGYFVMALALFVLMSVVWMILGANGAFQPGSYEVTGTWIIATIIVRDGRIEAVGVTLSHDRATVHDEHGVGRAEALRLGEGMVEAAIQEVAVHPAVELFPLRVEERPQGGAEGGRDPAIERPY